MSILLAPMEGLLDFSLRDVLTRVGGVDRCVTEFIRITDTLLPERAFKRIMPELNHASRTPAGVPVWGQLLGSDPACLAENAAKLASLGPAGIDLNFGCPAKVVNRHGGGAALLDDPGLLHRIVAAVRRAVPAEIPVSAKMRLGFNDDRRAEECAQAIEAGGARELVIHARTKAHGYRPPAYWDRIAEVRQGVSIPVVANGEIWSVADALRCQQESGCHALMLGRGMVADPGLALAIAAHQLAQSPVAPFRPAEYGEHPGQLMASSMAPPAVTWADLRPLLDVYWALIAGHVVPKHRPGRIKQWLNYLRRSFPEAEQAYQEVRTLGDSRQVQAWLDAHPTHAPDLAHPARLENPKTQRLVCH
jgi:tRNA-dihydrouridine synthase C